MTVQEGEDYRLTRMVDRYPHFTAEAGTVVTVTEVGEDQISARAQSPIDGAEEWDNEIHWYDDPEAGSARNQFELDTEPARAD